MSSWRDQILNEFTPHVARLTIVADPDGVLLEEGILEGIREKGFELIPFDDHIAFRYATNLNFAHAGIGENKRNWSLHYAPMRAIWQHCLMI